MIVLVLLFYRMGGRGNHVVNSSLIPDCNEQEIYKKSTTEQTHEIYFSSVFSLSQIKPCQYHQYLDKQEIWSKPLIIFINYFQTWSTNLLFQNLVTDRGNIRSPCLWSYVRSCHSTVFITWCFNLPGGFTFVFLINYLSYYQMFYL